MKYKEFSDSVAFISPDVTQFIKFGAGRYHYLFWFMSFQHVIDFMVSEGIRILWAFVRLERVGGSKCVS